MGVGSIGGWLMLGYGMGEMIGFKVIVTEERIRPKKGHSISLILIIRQ